MDRDELGGFAVTAGEEPLHAGEEMVSGRVPGGVRGEPRWLVHRDDPLVFVENRLLPELHPAAFRHISSWRGGATNPGIVPLRKSCPPSSSSKTTT